MKLSGQIDRRRAANGAALAAFGLTTASVSATSLYRVIREGGPVTIFTVGYERRDGDDLIAALRDAGIEHLADVRDKPISRKPDFRGASLRARCESVGIEYGAWSDLGSTEAQRERLSETGDLTHFHKVFRTYAVKRLEDPITR